MTSSLTDRCVDASLRRPWTTVASGTLLMLAAAVGVPFIGVTSDYLVLFSDDNPQFLRFRAIENTYSAADRALIAVVPRADTVFTREVLGAIAELTDTAWQAPYSSRVDSLTNYSHSEAVGEDDLVVAPLVENPASLTDADLARVEAIALDAVDLVGRLVARDRRAAGLVINFEPPPDEKDRAAAEINAWLDSVLAQARERHPGIDYYVTGNVPMHRALGQATAGDLRTRAPLAFLIILVLSALLLRSALGTVAVVAVVAFVVVTTMGIAGWFRVVFSPASSGVPIIVMIVAVADSIHVVASVLSALRRGLDRHAAIHASYRTNAHPILLTSVTTGLGFLSLNAADPPPFRDMGNFVALGVLWAFAYTMTLLPALLSLLPLRAGARSDSGPVFERFADFVIARRSVVLWSVALTMAVFVTGVTRIEFTNEPTRFFDESYEFRRDSDRVAERLTSLHRLDYSLEAGREGGISDPAYLRAVDAFAGWFREQPEVTYVQAFSDLMKRLNRNLHGDDPAFHRLPQDADLAAQYLLLYELSLPFGSDLNDRIDIAKSATRMLVGTRDGASGELRALDERAQAWIAAHAPGLADEASGRSMMFAHVTRHSIESMLGGTIFAMAGISFILIFVFRSLRIGLLSLVPNFIPTIASFGLWGYLVGQVGIASSVIVAIVFGIVVDDTIHFLDNYMKARSAGRPPEDAVRFAFRTAGQALLTTTLVLAAGFIVFATSGFEISWSLGLLVATTCLLALAADFLLLPVLLIRLDSRSVTPGRLLSGRDSWIGP